MVKINVSLVLFIALTMASCSTTSEGIAITDTPIRDVSINTPRSTMTPCPRTITPTIPTSTLMPALISTLWPYPTPRSVASYPDQVTDGILLFGIEPVENICHSIGEPIKIKVFFSNLSEESIIIAADFYVAPSVHGINGNLLPYISKADGERLYRPGDVSHYDTFPPTPDTFVTIPAKQTFSTTIEYFFPSSFWETTSIPAEELNTPEPGQYFVKFSYLDYGGNANAWTGIVGSNRIPICIQ